MKSPLRTVAGPLALGKTNKREAAVLQFAEQCQSVTWDFSKDGGAIGDISFGASLPAGAVVTALCVDKETAVTGATAVTLKAGSTALSDALNLVTIGTTSCPVLASSATAIKLAASSELKISIATAAATAGKVTFYVRFLKKP
jgi:hypothetical protein